MINEKTLELNITHELLTICRRYDSQSFAFGTTLVQERQEGYDSRIFAGLPQSWITSPLQYKRAAKCIRLGPSTFEYVFNINNNTYKDQHLVLYRLSGGRRFAAFYALPAIFTDTEFLSSLPNLLSRTFFVDVTSIRPAWVDNKRHTLHLLPYSRRARFCSKDELEVEVLSSEEFYGLIAEKQAGLPIYALRKNMKSPMGDDLKTRSARPRFLFNVFPRQDSKQQQDPGNARITGVIKRL